MFLVTAIGAISSTTVTTAFAVETLLDSSVTVNTMVLFPLFAHVKLDLSIDKLTLPQLSELLLFTSDATMLADPEAFK